MYTGLDVSIVKHKTWFCHFYRDAKSIQFKIKMQNYTEEDSPPPAFMEAQWFFFPYRSPEGRRWFPGGKPWFQDHGQRHRDTPPTAAPGPTHRLLERPPDTMWSILSVGNSLVMWTVNILHLVSQNPHRNLHMDLKTHPVLWNTPFSLDMLHTVNALFSKYC